MTSAPTARRWAHTRGATFLTTVVLLLVACTIAVVVVQQTLTSGTGASARTDRAVADRVARDLTAQFDAQLAEDPDFYLSQVFFAERPRVCDGDQGQVVAASGDPDVTVAWPASCGATWTYAPVGSHSEDYDPAQVITRAEVTPPTAGDPLLHLTVLASVGTVEAALERTWVTPSAAQDVLYSQDGVNLDTLAGPGGTVAVQGTVYTVGASSTPTRPEHTDAGTGAGPLTGSRLVSECGFFGPAAGAAGSWRAVDTTGRTAAGCTDPGAEELTPSDVRTLAPTPLTIDQATRSVADLVGRACPQAPASLTTTGSTAAAVTWSTSLCLRSGAQLVATDGTPVTVATPGGGAPVAYRLQFEGTAQQPTVRVFVASGDLSADPAAFAAGNHPVSDDGGTWTQLGVFALPRTGVVASDQTTYVGRCTASLDSGACDTSTAAADVTVLAGTPLAPKDLVVTGPVAGGQDAHVGLVATGQLRIAGYARPTQHLTLNASMFALGAGTDASAIITEPGAGGASGVLHVDGSLGGDRIGDLEGWSRVELVGAQGPSQFVSFTSSWRTKSTVNVASIDVCGQLRCSDVW